MVIQTDRSRWGSAPWLGAAAGAAVLLALTPLAHAGPDAVDAPIPAAAPGIGWGRGTSALRSADAHFIVMMIPHHDGAIAMAELAKSRARRPEIKALAQSIAASQSREITQMRQWYRQWFGTEVPGWNRSDSYRMGMGPGYGIGPGMGMGRGRGGGMGWGLPGMATSLEALKTGPDFDRAFIEQMIPHHRMGVMMASHAQWGTVHPELRKLEAAMVRVQSEEIEQMASWYRQWFPAAGT